VCCVCYEMPKSQKLDSCILNGVVAM
jgi:hypothetical protein